MILVQPCFGTGCLQSHSLWPPAFPSPWKIKMLCQSTLPGRQPEKALSVQKEKAVLWAVNQSISDSQGSTSSNAFERTWQATENTMFKFVCIAFVLHDRSTLTDADTPEVTLPCEIQKGTLRSELASLFLLAVPSELSLLGLSQVRGLCIAFFIKHSVPCTSESHLDLLFINTGNGQDLKIHNVSVISYSRLLDTLMLRWLSVLSLTSPNHWKDVCKISYLLSCCLKRSVIIPHKFFLSCS